MKTRQQIRPSQLISLLLTLSRRCYRLASRTSPLLLRNCNDQQNDSADEVDTTSRHRRVTRINSNDTSQTKPGIAPKYAADCQRDYTNPVYSTTERQHVMSANCGTFSIDQRRYEAGTQQLCLHKDYRERYGRIT